VSNVTLIPEI